MPARRASARPRARARRSGLNSVPRLPRLDQRQLDLVGLALVALGALVGGVLYAGWAGGSVGGAIVNGLAWLFGVLRYAAPVALVIGGALVVMRPLAASVPPLRAGAVCLLASGSLALAAGTFGLGPAGVRHGYWDPAYFRVRGGALGEALDWAA